MKWLLPLAILLAALALRIYRLDDANIWYDEGLAVWAARQSPEAIAAWTAADVHPPLYFWLLHGWRALTGESEFAVRWLSAACGTLAVAATYAFARSLVKQNPPAPLWRVLPAGAMVVLALSRFHIWWSQEARMYGLGSLLVVLSLYFTVKLRQRLTPFAIVGYLLATIAALYTLYLLAFLLVIEGIYWLATLPRTRSAPRSLLMWAALQAVTLGAFAPWLWYALPRMNHWSVQVPFEGGQFARLYATLLTVGVSTDIEQVTGQVLLLAGVIAAGVVLAWRTSANRNGLLLLLLALLIPPLIVWLATTFPRAFGYSPKPEARYFVPYLPAFAVLSMWGVAALAGAAVRRFPTPFNRIQSPVALVAIALMGSLLPGVATASLQGYYQARLLTDDYRSITATIRAYRDEHDAILLHSDQPWPVFAYYWPGAWNGVTYTRDISPDGTLTDVYPLWERHEALWLVVNEDAQRIDPQRQVETWLRSKAVAEQEWRFSHGRLLLFIRTPERATYTTLSPMEYVRWEQPLHRVRPGMTAHFFYSDLWVDTPVTITLGMGAPTAPVATSTVEIETPGLQRLQFDIAIPPDTPPAAYPLYLQQGNTIEQVSTLTVEPRSHPSVSAVVTVPPGARPLNAVLGNPPLVRMRAVSGERTILRSGDTVSLTLYWEALQPLRESYKVFVHLSAADELIWAQSDTYPGNNRRATAEWQTGTVIADHHTLVPGSALPPGRYRVWVGLYDAVTGVRVSPVVDENGNPQVADRLKVMEIVVEPLSSEER